MTRKQIRGLSLWAAALALAIVAIVPLAAGWRVLCVVAIACAALLTWLRASRPEAYPGDLLLAQGCAFPPASYPHPVLLVCGDGLVGLFGPIPDDRLALRVTDLGCYVRVPCVDQLQGLAAQVLAKRPAWNGQLSALLIVDPCAHSDAPVLTGQIRRFGNQVAMVRKRGVGLPVLVTCYLQTLSAGWFSWEAGKTGLVVREAGDCIDLSEWQQSANPAARLETCVQLHSATQWLAELMKSDGAGKRHSHAFWPAVAVAFVAGPATGHWVENNLWQRWLHEHTRLRAMPKAPATKVAEQSPFPDPLLHLLPINAPRHHRYRAQLLGLWLLVGAGVIALMSSAWQNTLLVRQVTDDLRRYQAATLSPHQEQALATLRQDALRLDDYYRQGEPWSLGLGLYQGERLRAAVHATISGHRRPATVPLPSNAREVVRLNSLSLFSSGSAQLKMESTHVLVKALVGIKAQPGWLIVITGHTDATGNDEQNLRLSTARAAAVHEWMSRMGDIPGSCFAVQGFGASQPIASNDTEHGRSLNRRVEIRLVPEPGACASPAVASGA